jgi:uncharacterized membrane protein YhaH (DUF805 family)
MQTPTQTSNPYAAPRANVVRGDDPEQYGEIKIFSASGRIGRVRFIGYTFGMTALIGILMAIAVGAVGIADPTLALVVAGVGYVALIVVQILLTIQRSHDFNVTGWLCLISLIPLAALIFWFVPGTPGENNYGKPPPPNTAGAVILACILPIIVIVGILAAIAIPAYQDYAQRAAEASQQQ